jgi:hypothetical protein
MELYEYVVSKRKISPYPLIFIMVYATSGFEREGATYVSGMDCQLVSTYSA